MSMTFMIAFLEFLNEHYLQMPPVHVVQYTTQILSVVVALLDDPDESVQLTAVSCLLTVNY